MIDWTLRPSFQVTDRDLDAFSGQDVRDQSRDIRQAAPNETS